MNQTKTKLIASASVLIAKNGYEATSVNDICNESNVTKGSFFHHFSSKFDLAVAVLDAYTDSVLSGMESGYKAKSADPLVRLIGILDSLEEIASEISGDGSILSGMVFAASKDASLHKEITTHMNKIFLHIKNALEECSSVYSSYNHTNNDDIADTVLATFEGCLVYSKIVSSNRREFINRAFNLLKSNIRQVFHGKV